MISNEKFDEIYQKIINENAEEMELARKEAQVENRNNNIVLVIIVVVNIIINYLFFKLTNEISGGLISFLIIISVIIHVKIKFRNGKSKIDKYTMDFKKKVVGTMIKSFEEKLEISPKERYFFKYF